MQLRRHGQLKPKSQRSGRGVTPCKVKDCGRASVSRGFCRNHYRQIELYGDVSEAREYTRQAQCSVKDCDKPHLAKGLCSPHYYAQRRRRIKEEH